MNHPDAIIIGSGHNGLIAGCYLAKAGYRIVVLEKNSVAGGAVSTETMFRSKEYPEGFRVDTGSSVHIMIHHTQIPEELGLAAYGLDYIEMDPFMSWPAPDGKGAIHFFRDLERTLDSIRQTAPEDVENYREFIRYWGRINRGVLNVFMKPPTGLNLVSEIVRGQFRDSAMFQKGEQMTGIRTILSSYGRLIENSFHSPAMRAALVWMAAQSGPTPEMTATADFAGWQSMLHQSGARHPRGGSGMLTQAMVALIEDHGGQVRTGTGVRSIVVEDGAVRGVVTESGEQLESNLVISNAHVQTTMMKMVGREHLDERLFEKIKRIDTGNGLGMVIRCAVRELPDYTASPGDPHIHNGMQLLAPSVQYMNEAMGDYRKGRPPEKPALMAMTFSKIDDEMAASGGHTLYAWAQWYPYELSGGLQWDEIREREADKIYDVLTSYAPNMEGQLIDRYIQTPLDIERRHGMLRGNVMHVEMNFDQMFMFRPLPELSRYETPIKNLWLCSASCHPGGGVFGAAGYNVSQLILRKHKRKTRFT